MNVIDTAILAIIKRAIANRATCPTNGEIADELNLASDSSVSEAIRRLRNAGLIQSRRIKVGRVVTLLETGESTCGKTKAPRLVEKAAIDSIDVTGLPRVNRDPCGFCGVRADIGCRHSVEMWRAAA